VGFGVGFAAAILLKLDWISRWFNISRILCWLEGARLLQRRCNMSCTNNLVVLHILL
jgi:hypothetical protein